MTLQQQLDAINAKIAAAKAEKTTAAKAMRKLQACKLTQRTAHKYFDLQAAYMAAIKGQ